MPFVYDGLAAALAVGVQSGIAQESFFNERFCARGTRRIARQQFPRLFVLNLGPMHCVRTQLGPLVHYESVVARPRQQPTTQGKSRRRNR